MSSPSFEAARKKSLKPRVPAFFGKWYLKGLRFKILILLHSPHNKQGT